MSRKLYGVVVGLFASVVFSAGTMQGCGSSSSSGDNVALCQKACDKALECTPDAGAIGQQAAHAVQENCATQVPTTHCSNEARDHQRAELVPVDGLRRVPHLPHRPFPIA